MSEALALIEQPKRRPKGVTVRQWRLAALYPRAESAYQAMISAGYAPTTSAKNASNILDRVGVKRASAAIEAIQADRARGIHGVSALALKTVEADLKELEPRDRIATGLKAAEIAAALGENVTQSGDGDSWKRLLHRYVERAFLRGRRSAENGNALRFRER